MEIEEFLYNKMNEKKAINDEYKTLAETYRTLRGIDIHWRFNQEKHRYFNAEEIEEMKKLVNEAPTIIAQLNKEIKAATTGKAQLRQELASFEEHVKFVDSRLKNMELYDNIWQGLEEKSMEEIEDKLSAMKTNFMKEVLLENYNEPVVRKEIASIMMSEIMGTESHKLCNGSSELEEFRKIVAEKISGARERVTKTVNGEIEALKADLAEKDVSCDEDESEMQ